MSDDPRVDERLEAVAGSATPYLIGVRHHSPACAAAIPLLLDAFAPERLMIELPADMQSWIPWVGDPRTQPPVALAATRTQGETVFFYPFARFSPEYAAIRWARDHGVPVEAFDLPLSDRRRRAACESAAEPPDQGQPTLMSAMLQRAGCPDSESLWDWLVEAPGLGADPEQVRGAALAFRILTRIDAEAGPGVSQRDALREAFMRQCLERSGSKSGARLAAVVGAFHAPALVGLHDAPFESPDPSEGVHTSLIPYAFDLLDSRSGYPAGIRDPMWHDRALSAANEGRVPDLAGEVIVEVARRLRSAGLVAGVPDACEAVRVARDLASLRGLAAPGRREVLEGITAAMGQGEPLGRGRILARALDAVMVGTRRGKLAPGTPRSGLVPHVEATLAELRLPGPGAHAERPAEVVLDPLRSNLDRRRHLALERLCACGVPYAARVDRSRFVDAETLTTRWAVHFTPSTDAALELAGVYGATLEQAAAGALRENSRKLELRDALTCRERLRAAESAAECGLSDLAMEWFRSLISVFAKEASLAELLDAVLVIERVKRGHVPGLPGFERPEPVNESDLLAAAVRCVDGLSGSSSLDDARGLHDLVRLLEQHPQVGQGRMLHTLRELALAGAPMIQGAACAVLALSGNQMPDGLGCLVGSWIDGASTREHRSALALRLRGMLVSASALFEAVPAVLDETHARLIALEDDAFLFRLPALRDGFEVLSTAARARLMETVGDRLGVGPLPLDLEHSPEQLAAWAAADRAGADAVRRLGWADAPKRASLDAAPTDCREEGIREQGVPLVRGLSPLDRWRLILGRERTRMGATAARLDLALEELYGHGHGEGSGSSLGAGQDHSFPTARDWAGEIEALFGAQVREEVLGRAAERGSGAAALELEPGSVTPSVELLHQVLALKGGLGEGQIARLRPLVATVIAQLVKELATRLQPALTGLATSRPTLRPAGPIDLRRTLSRNLRTARRQHDKVIVVAEHPVFRTRARRSLDWHLMLVVDVSGSMEPSVIYSAMMAAILSAIPALTVRFFAFNTEVIDMTDQVDDPLGLLLEVQIGGGTSIAKAVRYAREKITVPARTMVVVVTDFDEGLPVSLLVGEVRSLVEMGAKALGLATLDDAGKPRFNRSVAELVASAGMPVAALTPLELARWVKEQLR